MSKELVLHRFTCLNKEGKGKGSERVICSTEERGKGLGKKTALLRTRVEKSMGRRGKISLAQDLSSRRGAHGKKKRSIGVGEPGATHCRTMRSFMPDDDVE